MKECTIIIPVYNRTEQLKNAIESVLAQSFEQFELLIIDDGSQYELAPFIPKDPRIAVIRQTHGGVSSARNTGIKLADSKFICFLDSDDTWQPQKLAKQIAFMEQYPELLISQCEEIWIRKGKRVNPLNKHLKRSGYIFNDSLELCLISPSAVILRRELLAKVGLFDERLPACEDYDLWLRITKDYPVGLLAEKLVTRYGGHADQLSSHYWGMDRFRVQSMLKLLKTKTLNPEQREVLGRVLRQKALILAQGARKRWRLLTALYYYLLLLYN